MSLVYDFLKENPQQNARLISDGWRYLFTDSTVPYGVKQQLLEFSSLGLPFNDMNIYFYDMYTIDKMLGDIVITEPDVVEMLEECKGFCDALYSHVQQCPDDKPAIHSLFRMFAKYRGYSWLFNEFTYDDCEAIIACFNSRGRCGIDIGILLLTAFNDNFDEIGFLAYNNNSMRVFDYMTLNFIRKSTKQAMHSAISLSHDVPIPDYYRRYDSVNAIERRHDELTEAHVKKLLENKPTMITHTPEFDALVKEYGFYLPESSNTFIERGAKHNNCVSRYMDRHCRPISNARCTKLVFNKEATAELDIRVSNGLIVAVLIEQYKGAHNKDFPIPLELDQLRIALTGKPIDIIHITKEVDYGSED